MDGAKIVGVRGGGRPTLKNQGNSDAMSTPVTNESQPATSSFVSNSFLITLHNREWEKNYSITAKAENAIL